MKYHIITFLALALSAGACLGQTESQRTDSLLDILQRQVQALQGQVADLSQANQGIEQLESRVEGLQSEQVNLNSAQQGLSSNIQQLNDAVENVKRDGRDGRSSLRTRLESLQQALANGDSVMQALSASLDNVDSALGEASSTLAAHDSSLVRQGAIILEETAARERGDSSAGNKAYLGYFLAILVGVIAFILGKKAAVAAADSAKSDLSADIRRTRTEMDAGILKVDQKLMESLSKISSEALGSSDEGKEPDHGLALKVADEVNRMENNLSRMDPEVKGHKQLIRSIERVRDNMKANGYELVAHLGKPFDEGIEAEVEYRTDESFEDGVRVITRVNQPEVRFNEKVIQRAKFQVTQSA